MNYYQSHQSGIETFTAAKMAELTPATNRTNLELKRILQLENPFDL